MIGYSRRDFLKTLGAGFLSVSLPGCLPLLKKDKKIKYSCKPNIVLILADDLGYGDIKCYNPDSKIPTPNIDKLASQGLRFTDAHTNAAQCSPTRYGLLTGRYAWRTRLKSAVLRHFDTPLIEKQRLTVASLLKENGYATAGIGKWHLGLGWQAKKGKTFDPNSWSGKQVELIDFNKPLTDSPLDHGFDYYFGINASNNMLPYCYIENNSVVEPPTKIKEAVFDTEGRSLVAENFKSEQIDQVLWKKAKSWLERHFEKTHQEPFFLYYPTSAIHRPCLPIEKFSEKSQAGLRGDKTVELDSIVGKLMKELKHLGCENNTIVIFTSDNGPQPGDFVPALQKYARNNWGRPYNPDKLLNRADEGKFNNWLTYSHKPAAKFLGYKSTIYEGGHRVPLIVKWPKVVKPGKKSDEIVCLTDMMATFADIIDTKLPENAGEDSFSLLAVLKGQKLDKPIREAVVLDSWNGIKAVRQGQWKLILGSGSGGWYYKEKVDTPAQLYNIKDDPGETKNLYNDHPEVVQHLKALLEKYIKQGRSATR